MWVILGVSFSFDSFRVTFFDYSVSVLLLALVGCKVLWSISLQLLFGEGDLS